MGRWRTMGAAAVVSVAATAGLAAVAGAGVARPAHRPVVASPEARRAVAPTVALGEVTVHDLAVAAVVAPTLADPPAAQSVVQEVRLTVVGGPIMLETTEATVVLERVSGREWAGALPPVRVVDARGTHEGWDVRWSATGIDVTGTSRRVPLAAVRLEPGAPSVVAGVADGLRAGQPGPGVGGGRTLLDAEPGWGGGTYEAGGTVTVRLPGNVDATSVTVRLAFALA